MFHAVGDASDNLIARAVVGRCDGDAGEPSPAQTPSAASPGPIAGATCHASQITLDVVHPGFGAGNVGAWLRFRNASSVACRLHGWPTLVGVTAEGDRTTAGKTTSVMTFPESFTTAPRMVLAPGDIAYAAFEGSDTPPEPPASCPPDYVALELTLPADTDPIAVSAWNDWLGALQPACAGLEVTMILPASDVPTAYLH
jgi:hypothetical protein